jgi:hypothetical protein
MPHRIAHQPHRRQDIDLERFIPDLVPNRIFVIDPAGDPHDGRVVDEDIDTPAPVKPFAPKPVYRHRVLQVRADQLDALGRQRGGRMLGAGPVAAVMGNEMCPGSADRDRDFGADPLGRAGQ